MTDKLKSFDVRDGSRIFGTVWAMDEEQAMTMAKTEADAGRIPIGILDTFCVTESTGPGRCHHANVSHVPTFGGPGHDTCRDCGEVLK